MLFWIILNQKKPNETKEKKKGKRKRQKWNTKKETNIKKKWGKKPAEKIWDECEVRIKDNCIRVKKDPWVKSSLVF